MNGTTSPHRSALRATIPVLIAGALAWAALGSSSPAAWAEGTDSVDISFSEAGYEPGLRSPVGQNGWSFDTRTTWNYDYSLVAVSDFPASGLSADVALRFSNATGTSSIGQLISPALGVRAGESSVAAHNTFTTEFIIASATGAYQEGLAVEVSAGHATDRSAGMLQFRHVDGGLEIGTAWVVSDATTAGTSEWRSVTFPGPLSGAWDPSIPHTVTTRTVFVDDGPDTREVRIDGALVALTPSWEYYHAATASQPALPVKTVANLVFKTTSTRPFANGVYYQTGLPFAPATAGGGFLFADISYRSSTSTWTPIEPRHTPFQTAADLSLPESRQLSTAPEMRAPNSYELTLGEKFARRYVGVFSQREPSFLGWYLTSGTGSLRVTLAEELGIGAHTLTLYDTTGTQLAWVSDVVVSPTPPLTSPTPTPPVDTPTPPVPGPSAVPTTQPSLDPLPAKEPDGAVPLPHGGQGLAPGAEVIVTFPAGTFQPYENVYTTWYSSPLFGGWFQADAKGGLVLAVTVPHELAAGRHTLQVTAPTSNLVYASRVTVAAAPTGPGAAPAPGAELPTTGAGSASLGAVAIATILAGGALVGLTRRRRLG